MPKKFRKVSDYIKAELPQGHLTSRWTSLRYHPEQYRLWKKPSRFNVNPAGRRSGKTEIAKRKLVKHALKGTEFEDPRFFAAAPTRDQAKRIYWDDLKRLTPRWAMARPPFESDLSIHLINGSSIHVLGMDKPERVEGVPWDGGVLDEFGNMRKTAWGQHIRPALSDRKGWCDLIGVPEGRNHYYDLYKQAQADDTGEWDTFWWISADILPPEEIAAAKRDLDELTYQQEYEACHSPDTLIKLWNGEIKKVYQIKPGDVLVSFQEGKYIPTTVLNVGKTGVKRMLEVELEDGTTFYASEKHKMRVGGVPIELSSCNYLEKVPLYFKPITKQQALAAVVGFNLGDGNIGKNKKGDLGCGFFSQDRESMEDLQRDLGLAGIRDNVPIYPRKNGWVLQFGNNTKGYEGACDKMVAAGCIIGRKPTQDFGVPDWIKVADKDVQRCFLAALWGAEGRSPTSIVKKSSGKRPQPHNIHMFSKRLVRECGELLASFDIESNYVEKGKDARLYVREGFLDKIGYLYCPKKQELTWLWQQYRQCALGRYRQIIKLRKQGMVWWKIGQIVGLKMNLTRQIGMKEKYGKRISNFFDPFDTWVNKHFHEGRLKLQVIGRHNKVRRECWNILVDSPDHSYLLNSEIDNFNSFINFTGRAYYAYMERTHNARISYDPTQPIGFCFDFNVAPGVAVVIQEKQVYDLQSKAALMGETVTGVIGEVYIPRNSNTPLVCTRLITDWGDHQGRVQIYGDATGGASGTAKLGGSDWDLVKKILGKHFGERMEFKVPAGNPSERDRVNSMNSRLKTMEGRVRLMVDPVKAPWTVKDLEGVQCVEGGSGEIDKKKNPELSHLSDALGYYVHKEYPIRKIQSGMAIVRGF